MAIALSVRQYLDDHNVKYDLVVHDKTKCSADTAHTCHIPENELAKGVVVKRKKGYLLAILPASRKLRLGKLGQWLKQPICLASEDEISDLFDDCDIGAVPPIGEAYGLKAVVDETLNGHEDIYLEAGDHKTLIHMTGKQFERLMKKVPHENFCTAPNMENTLPDMKRFSYWGA